jgi:undecaprenyl-diphosphooligosaccharide---protein glycotransferase
LMSGMRYADPIFISTQVNNEDDHYIYLHNGATINKSSATIKLGDKELPINRFVKTGYKQDGKLDVDQKQFSSMSDINVIYMESYGKFLIVDEATYNSLYVQLFVLENYDKNLFEAVQLTPYAKIFKLKI